MISQRRFIALCTVLFAASAAACSSRDANTSVASAVPVAQEVPVGAFTALRWLEGSWRGVDEAKPDSAPFFERYRMANDSTIVKYDFADSTFSTAGDSSLIAWRGGEVSNTGGVSVWIATRVDAESVHFEPSENATNAFTFVRGQDGSWRAVLSWRDSNGAPKQRVYRMTRQANVP